MNNILKRYRGVKVIVTGSTGFKGSWLSFWLFLLGAKVTGVSLKPEKGSIIFKCLKLEKKIKQYYINIDNFKSINNIIKKTKPKIIFHLAAQSIVFDSFKNPLKTFSSNVTGSINILESCRLNKVSSLVYITSDKCYLNLDKKKNFKETDRIGGSDNYSASKACAEIVFNSYFNSYFKKKHLSLASTRAGNVIGGGDLKKNRIIPDVYRSIKEGKSLILRNPKSTRPWQHVLEPLSGYLILGEKLMSKKLTSKIIPNWNFGPKPKNAKKVIVIVKSFIKNWKISKKITIKDLNKFHESKLLSLNITKANKELKWKPKLTLDETIKLTCDWYKKYHLKKINMEKFTENQIKYYVSK